MKLQTAMSWSRQVKVIKAADEPIGLQAVYGIVSSP